MTRRGGRLTRVALRLGLLLGGVAVAWGAHEAATDSAAHAADRPPATPLTAVVDLLGDTLSPVLDVVTPHSPRAAGPPPAVDARPVPGDRAGARADQPVATRPEGRHAAAATRPGPVRDGGRRPADRRPGPDARHDGRPSAPDARHHGRRSAPDARHDAPRSGGAARDDTRRPA
ncbi:hypothetical protein ABZ452_31340, partial [Micromonospora sp. NPDC005707]